MFNFDHCSCAALKPINEDRTKSEKSPVKNGRCLTMKKCTKRFSEQKECDLSNLSTI